MKSVSYTSSTKLNCGCDADVIICLDVSLVAANVPYIDGTLAFSDSVIDSCSRTKYRYALTYNEGLLLDPTYSLVESDIHGVLCRGCLTDYIDSQISTFSMSSFCFISNQQELIDCQTGGTTQGVVIAPFAITQAITVIKPLYIIENCPITTNGHILTLNCNFNSGLYQCFVTTPGEVTFQVGATAVFGLVNEVHVEWFGAKGDGVTDDTVAMQCALTANQKSFFPIVLIPRRRYIASTLYLHERCHLYSKATHEGAPIIKSNGAGPLLVFPIIPGGFEANLEINNIGLDGANTAASLIQINFTHLNQIHDCMFMRGAIGIDHTTSGYWNKICRNRFYDCDICIKISGSSHQMHIEQNVFNGTGGTNYSILSDVLARMDRCTVVANAFEDLNTMISAIKFEVDPTLINGNVHIVGNSLEGNCSGPLLDIGEGIQGVVEYNVFNGNPPAAPMVLIKGRMLDIRDNFFIGASFAPALVLDALSVNCTVGPQHMSIAGGPFSYIVDNSLNNHVDTEVSINWGGLVTLTAPKTVTTPLTIPEGGMVTTNGNVLTINGPFKAGAYQCFTAAVGEVVFGRGSVEKVLPEWWGAYGDNAHDDIVPLTKALTAAATYHLPTLLGNGKRYLILSPLTLPIYADIGGEVGQIAAPMINMNNVAGGDCLICSTANAESYIHIHDVSLQGRTASTSLININANRYITVENCYLNVSTVGILHHGNSFHNSILKNTFLDCVMGISLDGNCTDTHIRHNIFSGTYEYAINTAITTTGLGIIISENNFFGSGIISAVNLLVPNGNQGLVAIVEKNIFQTNATTSHVNVSKDAGVHILNNIFSGVQANLIVIDGYDVVIDNNSFMLSTAEAIKVTANSVNCTIGFQLWGRFGGACAAQITDAGTRTRIARDVLKDTTANRPTRLATEYGAFFLDTTLDADGLPIWWNGTKWIKADGGDA